MHPSTSTCILSCIFCMNAVLFIMHCYPFVSITTYTIAFLLNLYFWLVSVMIARLVFHFFFSSSSSTFSACCKLSVASVSFRVTCKDIRRNTARRSINTVLCVVRPNGRRRSLSSPCAVSVAEPGPKQLLVYLFDTISGIRALPCTRDTQTATGQSGIEVAGFVSSCKFERSRRMRGYCSSLTHVNV